MPLEQSPLSQVHEDDGANVTNVAGWQVPMEFDAIRLEHTQVRTAAGQFDLSYLGKVRVSGPEAPSLVDELTTNRATELDPGEAQASCLLDSDGCILDYVIVYCLPEPETPAFLVVCNPGRDEFLDEWMRSHRDEWDRDATLTCRTRDLATVAVQGPDATGHVSRVLGSSVTDIDRFEAVYTEFDDARVLVSRTGYTGEDGFELFPPRDHARAIWDRLDCQPCGIGARDTLRLETGFVRAGAEFDDDNRRTPLEAGLSPIVDLDTRFVGEQSLRTSPVRDRLVGLRVLKRGVPKPGCAIRHDGSVVGEVTSGTLSPTLDEGIGLGYVDQDTAAAGSHVEIELRDRIVDAVVVDGRFYDGPATDR